jgi:hypothetical protein
MTDELPDFEELEDLCDEIDKDLTTVESDLEDGIELDNTWATGTVQARPGEQITFTGELTGINPTVEVIFYPTAGDTPYRFGDISMETPAVADPSAGNLAVKHAEMALIDAGWNIDPLVAPDTYGDSQ